MSCELLLADALCRLKAEIDEHEANLEEADTKTDVLLLMNGGCISGVKFFANGWDAEDLLDRNVSEDKYLLHAASWHWLSREAHARNDFAGALLFLSRSYSAIGGLNALLGLRRQNSLKAHKENRQMREQAVEYWRTNIDPSASNDAAGKILAAQVPLSARVLSRYVSEAKKEAQRMVELAEEIKKRPLSVKFIRPEKK